MNNNESQTPLRGSMEDEYDIYLANCTDEHGLDITSGEVGNRRPPKTFQEWLNS